MDATYRSRWYSHSIEPGSGSGWLSVTPDGPGPMEPPPEPEAFSPWFERVSCARNVRALGYWSFFWSPYIRIIRKPGYISNFGQMSAPWYTAKSSDNVKVKERTNKPYVHMDYRQEDGTISFELWGDHCFGLSVILLEERTRLYYLSRINTQFWNVHHLCWFDKFRVQ